MLWESASIPTAAVRCAGSPAVTFGSSMTMTGSIFGWNMMRLVWSSRFVITPARPTSEPVPDVVGTAMTGAMPSAFARVYQSSRSSKSQMGRVCPTINAMHLPTSMALPPPKATTPSWAPSR